MAVAHYYCGGWQALIAVIPGKSHMTEYRIVLNSGTPLAEHIAMSMFPEFGRGLSYVEN